MFDLIDEDVFADIVARSFGVLDQKYAKELLDEPPQPFWYQFHFELCPYLIGSPNLQLVPDVTAH